MKNIGKVLCTICAREGSKGVKNKNIRKIVGKPLIVYTIEQAKLSGLFEDIVISSDSDKILEVGKDYNLLTIKRPKELSLDTSPKIPVIRHALLKTEKNTGKKYDYIIDLDITSPLREIDDIKNAFFKFLRDNNDILFSVTPAHRSPYFNMVEITEDGYVKLVKDLEKPITRRQDAPKCYDMNASIYIWKRDILLSKDTLFTDNTGIYIMPPERSIDIDSELDFDIVEFLILRKRGEKNE